MPIVRRLSDIEASFAYMHAEIGGCTQVTTEVSLKRCFSRDVVAAAVARWMALTPLLRLRIVEIGDDLWFEDSITVDAVEIGWREMATFEMTDLWLSQELNDNIPTGGPLWRLRVIYCVATDHTHFFFSRNHAISDGYTTTKLWRTLIGLMLDTAAPTELLGQNIDELTYRAPRPDRPDDPSTHGIDAPVAFAHAMHAPPEARQASVLSLPVTVAQSQAVLQVCRREAISVNQWFSALLCQNFSEVAGVEQIGYFTAVSLRQRYDQPTATAPGCVISVVYNRLDRPGQTELTTLARRYGDAFRRADAQWRPAPRPHSVIRHAVRQLARRQSSPGLCITNLGALDEALGPNAELIDVFRTIVNRKAANYTIVLHLSMLAGQFSVHFTFAEPCIKRAMVEKVGNSMSAQLQRIE